MALVSVVGATGRQGLAQVRQLVAAGHSVRALSRNENPDLGPTNADIETRVLDLYDRSTYVKALEGSDAVFYNHPLQLRDSRAELAGWIGAAAKEVDAKRFVWNTSSWIPDKPGDPFSYAGNTAGINALFRSGVPATVFGSVLFMDNLLTNWARPFIMHERRYVYPHKPTLGANWISLDDVAKIMIHAMDRPDMEGTWMNIGGPERILPPKSRRSSRITSATRSSMIPARRKSSAICWWARWAIRWLKKSANPSRQALRRSTTTTTTRRPSPSKSTWRR